MPKRGAVALDRPASAVAREAVVTAALEQLDKEGLARTSLPALADSLRLTPADLSVHFPTQDALIADIAKTLAEAAEDPQATDGSAWRDVLRARALIARTAMLSRRDGALLFAQLPAFPPVFGTSGDAVAALTEAGFSLFDAQAAVQLIDRFAVGWTIVEQRHPDSGEDETLASYADQLDTLLAGLAHTRAWGGTAAKHRQFQSRLWVFLRHARDSANIAFARQEHIAELDRRILLLLQAKGDLTLAAVSAANGVDKAQVSRSIKRLHELGFVQRSGIRSPLRLSATGRQLADRLVRLAELRNRELTFGIDDDQLVDLFGVLDTLLARSISLFEQERKIAQHAPEGEMEFPDHVDKVHEFPEHIPVDRSRLLPPFITLCSYMLRAASLGFKRRTGLSNFDTWVLTEVCKVAPISWPQLVLALFRDQSQAGRTVNRLIEIGLVERSGKPGRRHGYFSPTKEGERIYKIINDMAARRSEYLFRDIPAPQLNNFMTAFDVLARNAEVQLARERAIQEMDRG